MVFELHNLDVIEFLNSQQTGKFGLIATDLPYGETRHRHDTRPTQRTLSALCSEFNRLTNKDGSVFTFCAHHQLEQMKIGFHAAGFPRIRMGTWLNLTGTKWTCPYGANSCEFWIYATKGQSARQGLLPFYASGLTSRMKDFQTRTPFRKPIGLMRTIILNHSKPDDYVLDCFAGSGSTGVAALLEGRKPVLNDIADYKMSTIRASLERFKEFETHKPLENYLIADGIIELQMKHVENVAKRRGEAPLMDKSKKETKTKTRQRLSADKKEQLTKIILEHNFDTPIQPADFIDRVRSRLKMPTMTEEQLYRFSGYIVRTVKDKKNVELVLPRESAEDRILRVFDEYSQNGKVKPLHVKPAVKKTPKKTRKRNTPSAQQPLLPAGIEKERRGNTEGASIEAKESRIVKRAKIATGIVKGQRKEDKTIPPVTPQKSLKVRTTRSAKK